MLKKKVSVIVPFYENTDWLCQAIESVLNQSYNNIEIIVINDGSHEDVSYFLQKYSELIHYRSQKNQGSASARNLGLQLATGYYIAFLDSDDIWLPSKLEKQIAFMEESGSDWSHTGYYSWNPDTKHLKTVNNKDDFGDISKKSYVSLRIATPSIVIRSSVFEIHPDLRFNENYRIGQDTKLWQKIGAIYPLALIREPLVKVRMRENNTYKQTTKVIKLRAQEYRLNSGNNNLPTAAKVQGRLYSFYDNFFNHTPSAAELFVARCLIVPPYIIGRSYSKYHAFLNHKYKYLVLK